MIATMKDRIGEKTKREPLRLRRVNRKHMGNGEGRGTNGKRSYECTLSRPKVLTRDILQTGTLNLLNSSTEGKWYLTLKYDSYNERQSR